VLIAITLLISWLFVFDLDRMSQERKLFIYEMIQRKIGSSFESIKAFVIGATGSAGKRALVTILVLILLPVWIALWWILGIPGVIYAIYKNVKYQPIRRMGLTSFGIFVAYAAPFFCFPLVPGIIMIERLIMGPLLNRIGIGRMIVAKTESSYILLPIIEVQYFDFGKPTILQLSQCKVSLISRKPKKTKIKLSFGSNKKIILTVLKKHSFSNISEREGIDILLVE